MTKYLLLVLPSLLVIVLMAPSAFRKSVKMETISGGGVPVFCAPSFDPEKLKTQGAPLFKGFSKLHYKVTTNSPKAQQYFNQGLALLYAFNHGEAGRSFKQVIRLDSTCAMGYWGLALILGPNYNAALDTVNLREIHDALDSAIRLAPQASPEEQALIYALTARFPATAVKDMTPYKLAYTAAMRQAHEKFPADVEIAVLYAEAMMNEHPWDLWLDDGTAQPWTPIIIQLLENILIDHPDHPGAMHLYIHAIEASGFPDKALPVADRLVDLIPAAGHLVHMPSHIYLRTGNYHKGVVVNEKASVADSSYIAQCKVQGMYPMIYYPHNVHFLAACAFLEGNGQKALDAAWIVSRLADKKYLAASVSIQHFYIIPWYTLVHLARWDEILALPMPGESLKYPNAIYHYARGMAFTAKGQLQEAELELKNVQAYAADETLRPLMVWDMNSVLDLMKMAALVLEGEMAGHRQEFEKSIALLREAVKIEDGLNYIEPPDWFFSVRHTLGHVLVQAKQFAQAEKIYLEDLRNLPENGWALIGLYNSLQGQDKPEAAAAVKKRFKKAWKWADMDIVSSRKY